MPTLAADLNAMADYITQHDLHTGDQFIDHLTGNPDISALAYLMAESVTPPGEFFVDEVASLRLIEASAPTMQLLRAVSEVLTIRGIPSCVTEVAPGVEVPDYIEHVSNWAATPAIGHREPPTRDEIIDCLRTAAANAARTTGVPAQRTTSPAALPSRFPRQRHAA